MDAERQPHGWSVGVMVTLSTGREVVVDLHRVSLREYRALFEPGNQENEDEIIARAAGMAVEELLDLPFPDYRRIVRAFFDSARDPLADPNSVSASTSP